jgi:hypothetical protein
MADDFSGLSVLTIGAHGDARERDVWPDVAGTLSNYEAFWRELIVLLTNRIIPAAVAWPDWIRLRPAIPRSYEQLAMHNYSLFYYAAMARRAIDDDRKRLGSRAYPHPERIFAAMQAAIEQAKPLQGLARDHLRGIGVERWRFPRHPQGLYETIGSYRNAFLHNPVLGRAVDQGRELLPSPDRLLKGRSPMLWRDSATIPTAEMIDGFKLEEDLWQRLADFLQAQWMSLTDAFIEARKHPQFIDDLGLIRLLPIRCAPPNDSLAGPVSASGTIIVARSDTH